MTNHKRESLCDMCLEMKKTRYLDLYISGSEGTRLCHDCEMLLVRFIRDNARITFRKRKASFLTRRSGRQLIVMAGEAWQQD